MPIPATMSRATSPSARRADQAADHHFPGNDNGGANGQALAAIVLSGVGVDLLPGDHTLDISATVKDNAGKFIGNANPS
jgi:hypothetical protein